MIKRFCDRCGQEIIIGSIATITFRMPSRIALDITMGDTFDVCDKCYEEMMDMMNIKKEEQ
jgi:hypothetical protein